MGCNALGFQLLGCLDALPGGWQPDEHLVLSDPVRLELCQQVVGPLQKGRCRPA